MSGAGTLAEWIAPARTALLVIDLQVDFACPEGALGRAGADLSGVPAALAKAERLVAVARRAGTQVVFLGMETSPQADSAAWAENSRRRGQDPGLELALCRAGSLGARFVGPRPRAGELVVRKPRYSGFVATDLEARLRAGEVDTIVACGLTTECCVATTAFDAFQRDFHVFVASDACAAYGAQVHAAALGAMRMNGMMPADAATLEQAWAAAP